MNTYIAFLRGINVGGKNKISMPLLKAAFEDIGFSDVITYINSGNLIFTSNICDKNELTRKSESAITARFGLKIPVVIVAANELAELLEHAPVWWDTDKEAINYAIFVISPVSTAEVFAAVGEAKPEYETVDHYGNVIFWSAPRKTFSKARWSKIAGSPVNYHVTIRNANTVKKLFLLSR